MNGIIKIGRAYFREDIKNTIKQTAVIVRREVSIIRLIFWILKSKVYWIVIEKFI
jgi:hypothetical protein